MVFYFKWPDTQPQGMKQGSVLTSTWPNRITKRHDDAMKYIISDVFLF